LFENFALFGSIVSSDYFPLDQAGDLAKIQAQMLKNSSQAVILVVVVVNDAVGAC
jgi:hypothetical protein